jgi:hypothetical protein
MAHVQNVINSNEIKILAGIFLMVLGLGVTGIEIPSARAEVGSPSSGVAVRRQGRGALRGPWARFRQLRQRYRSLARDPAHNGKITKGSRREAYVGLRLEARGALPGPIVREKSGSSEFVDAAGRRWDVKAFNSHFPPERGGFVLERALSKLSSQFRSGEKVILDTANLTPHHLDALRRGVEARGWRARVLWYP